MTQIFGVITFKRKGRSLQSGQPRSARTADAAIALADQLSTGSDGVVAYEQSIDVEADIYDAPVVLFRHGEES